MALVCRADSGRVDGLASEADMQGSDRQGTAVPAVHEPVIWHFRQAADGPTDRSHHSCVLVRARSAWGRVLSMA
jgi:hypothetical protein